MRHAYSPFTVPVMLRGPSSMIRSSPGWRDSVTEAGAFCVSWMVTVSGSTLLGLVTMTANWASAAVGAPGALCSVEFSRSIA
jgi:hypothetical protein